MVMPLRVLVFASLVAVQAVCGLCLVFATTSYAAETLTVTVLDNDGSPVSNATVSVGFSTSNVIFGGGHSSGGSGKAMARTDTNGVAVVKFDCKSSDFGWHVEADGYYRGNSHSEHFDFEEIIIPPVFSKVILHEHEKSGTEVLWKKCNPLPMFAHGVECKGDVHKVPNVNGRFGFDMMKYDWLPPWGKGEIADFNFVRRFGEKVDDGVWGWLEFSEKCGMYTGKQTGSVCFPSTYQANTNANYVSRIPFVFDHLDNGVSGFAYKDIVKTGEYGVMRTRVECDAHGNIVKANYSKVLGPFYFGDWSGEWVIITRSAVFNPRVNDPNLEFDMERNFASPKTDVRWP